MMKRLFTIFISLCWSLLTIFCCSTPKATLLDADKQPYRFQHVMDLEGNDIVLADLDANGFTEIITITSLTPDQCGFGIMLKTFEGKIIEQVNYSGRIINQIFPLDFNGDGMLELFVPYVRNDSLFVSIVSHQGKKLFHWFLIDGTPRIEDGGYFNWDPQIRGCYVRDLNDDGTKELITVLATGYSRLPRGVLVHSLPDGKLIGKSIVGSPPRDNFLDDFDGNGKLEVLCFGTSPNNGAIASGFDDEHSYLIVFELKPIPEVVRWKEFSNKYSYYVLFYEDLDGNNSKELIAWTESYSKQIPNSRIVELNPITLREVKTKSFDGTLNSVVITNLNHDIRLEIVAIRSQNEILAYDSNFNLLNRRRYPLDFDFLKALPDADNDGIPELVVGNTDGEYLFNSELKIKASLSNANCIGIIRRGEYLSRQIVLKTGDRFSVVQLTKNPFYLVNRYYSLVLYLFTGGLLLLLTTYIIKLSWHNRLFRLVHTIILNSDSRGLLLFDGKQKINMMNNILQKWFDITDQRNVRKHQLKELFSRFPEILAFITDSITEATYRHEKTFSLKIDGQKQTVQLLLDPLPIKKRTPHWLATFIDKSANDEALQVKTWCKIAQKIAHDIKNPLSSIMLTLQRLQMLNQQQSNQASSENFDLHIKRIIERVESLRRISKNFMKFVNIESLNFVNTDLNQFLIETADIIRPGLPPDIQLHLKPTNELPMVKIDQDSIRSVIENLVSNAINALPEGGMITIATQFLQGLVFPGNGKCAKDYILIEVADTGVGIAETDRDHLFEPDFTRTENGNGLGLAYVKKTVDDHNGYIEVESEPGAGTLFNIYIPTI